MVIINSVNTANGINNVDLRGATSIAIVSWNKRKMTFSREQAQKLLKQIPALQSVFNGTELLARKSIEAPERYLNALMISTLPEVLMCVVEGYSPRMNEMVRNVNARVEDFSQDSLKILERFGKHNSFLDLSNIALRPGDLQTLARYFPNAETLDLSRCNLTDASLGELTHFTRLVDAKLCGNRDLTDVRPLKNCLALRNLDISDCCSRHIGIGPGVPSPILSHIDELTQLKSLHMDNLLYGGPENQKRVEDLEQSGVRITGQGPEGARGPVGLTGPLGSYGELGFPGTRGERGFSGQVGAPGADGT